MPRPTPEEVNLSYERLLKLPPEKRLDILRERAARQRMEEAWSGPRRFQETVLTGASFPFPVERILNAKTGTTRDELYTEPRTLGQKAENLGAELLGTVPSMMIPFGAAAQAVKGATVLGKIGRGAWTGVKYGAGFGGVSAAIAPDSTLGSITEQTAVGGAFGGLLGGGGSAAWMGLRKLAGKPAVELLTREAIESASPTITKASSIESIAKEVPPTIPKTIFEEPTLLSPKEAHGAFAARKTLVQENEFNALTRRTAAETAQVIGVEPTTLAIRPAVQDLSVEETTRLFSHRLNQMDSAQVLATRKLMALERIRTIKTGAGPVDREATKIKALLVEKRASELGIRGQLTDDELTLLRETLPLPSQKVAGTVRRGLIADTQEEFTRILHERNPKPEGSIGQLPEVIIKEAPSLKNTSTLAKTIPATAARARVSRLRQKLFDAEQLSQQRTSAISNPETKVLKQGLQADEKAMLHADINKLADEIEAKIAGGMAAGHKISQKDANLFATMLAGHYADGIKDEQLLRAVQRLVAEGWEAPPVLKAKLEKVVPEVFQVERRILPTKSDMYKVLVRQEDGNVRSRLVDGTEFAQLNQENKIAMLIGEAPPTSALITESTAEAVAQGAGAMPEVLGWWGRTKQRLLKGVKQFPLLMPIRVFELEKAPGLIEAFRSMTSVVSKARAEHFDTVIASIYNTLSKLNKEELGLLTKRLYSQETMAGSVFSKPGSKYTSEIDKAGSLITYLRKKTFEFKAESYRKNNGYYAEGVTAEFKKKMDEDIAKHLEKVKQWLPHQWSEKHNFLVFYDKEGRPYYRTGVNNNQERDAAIKLAIQEHGSELGRDRTTGNVLFTNYTPQDYIKTYGDTLDYDSMLKALNLTPSITGAERTRLLEIAARGSGKVELINRKWVAGFDQTPEQTLKYVMQDVEHALHQRGIVETKGLLDEAIRLAPNSVQDYAREWRTAILTRYPDYTYKARSFMYTTLMGGSIRFLMQQSVQNFMYSSGHFLAEHPNLGIRGVGAALKEGYKWQFTATKKLPTIYRNAMRKLEKIGALDVSFLGESGARSYERVAENTPISKAAYALRWVGNKSEQVNRRNAAIQSLFINMQKGGMALDDAVKKAHLDILSIHNLYARENRPLFIMKMGKAEPLAAVAWMFQSFPVNAISQFIKIALSGSKKAMAVQAGTMIAAAGALGIPGLQAANSVVKWFSPSADIQGKIHEGLTAVQKQVYSNLGMDEETARAAAMKGADILAYGAPGAAGIDATTFLGLSNFPFSDFSSVAGLYQSVPAKITKSIDLWGKGEYWKSAETIIPFSQAARFSKAARWAKDGAATDYQGIPLLRQDGSKFEPTPWEVGMTATGLNTLDEARHYQAGIYRKELIEGMRRKNADLNMDFAKAIVSKDDAKMRDLREKVIKNNLEIQRRMKNGEDVSTELYLKPSQQSIRQNVQLLIQGRTVALARSIQERRIMAAQQQKHSK